MANVDESGGWTLKGWHVAAMFIGFFGTIIAVNLFMASKAIGTFPGLEARNGFAESQTFQERRAAQLALGWQVDATLQDGVLAIAFTDAEGAPVEVASMEAVIGKATHVQQDQEPEFTYRAGVFRTPMALEPGNWNIRLRAVAPDGTPFVQRVVLEID